MSRRHSKLASLDDAVALVRSGDTLALGGFWYHNQPAEFARALVRSGVGGLRLTGAPVGGYAHDLLVATGAVDRLLTPHVSFDELGLSPSLRTAAESGALVIEECEEASLVGSYKAGAQGLAALPVQSLRETALAELSPLVRPSAGGLAGKEAIALVPDVAVLHVAECDEYGNGRHHRSFLADRLLARVSRRVVLTTERVIGNDEIRSEPRFTTVLGIWVDAVLELPGGALPGSCHGVYGEDRAALERYVAACEARRRGDPSAFDGYLAEIGAGGAAAR